jgi:predicted permease
MSPGITPEIVAAALSATMPAGRQVLVVPLSTALTARLRGLATGALLASGLIVLVCWTNVFNIALTRGLYRGPEFATRTALGATPRRLVRLLASEGLKVAVLGGAGALVVSWLTLAAAVLVLPPQFTTLGVPSITTRVVLAIALAGAVAGVSWCAASIAAWQLGAGRRARVAVGRDGRAIRLVRFAVVAGQLGAASVLLAGAALLGRSYANLLNVDGGMDDRTETVTVAHDPNVPQALRRDAVERVLAELRRAEGVQAAGASLYGFLDGAGERRLVRIDGQFQPVSSADGTDQVMRMRGIGFLDWTTVTGDYFQAMGLELVAGRSPGPDEGASVVVNESLAEEYFGQRSPIGEVIPLIPARAVSIVGVVRDVRSRSLTVPPRPSAYELGADDWGGGTVTYVVRFAETSSRRAGWERIVQEMDPMAVVLDSGSVRERLDRSIRDRTFATLVVGLFALASVLVTALGLAGVVAYTVVKRTREIAVRLTLGATGPGVTRLVVRDAVAAGTSGVVAGVIASVWLSRALESLLYDVRPADPATLLLTGASLLGIVLGAAVLPAIRAARIAPAMALRIE